MALYTFGVGGWDFEAFTPVWSLLASVSSSWRSSREILETNTARMKELLIVPTLLAPDTSKGRAGGLSQYLSSLPVPGLLVCARRALPGPHTHSCNPVTTTGDITHSWPISQWCQKEQNVLGPGPAPYFTWAPPRPGQGQVDGVRSSEGRGWGRRWWGQKVLPVLGGPILLFLQDLGCEADLG